MESTAVPVWLSELRLSARENLDYVEAARRAGLEVHHWVRQVLNRAAQEVLGGEGRLPPEGDS